VKLVAVYGVPGTGKTTYLLKRIAELVTEEGYDLSDIAYFTFRRTMAEDFLDRLYNKLENRYEGSDGYRRFIEDTRYISTIHSVSFRLLQNEFNYTRDHVAKPWKEYVEFCRGLDIPVSEEDMKRIKNEEEPVQPEEFESLGYQIYTVYSNCVNMDIDFVCFTDLPPYMRPRLDVSQMPSRYRNVHECVIDVIDKWITYLEENNLIDFPMMLKKAWELRLKPNVAICMSDESHDMTPIQIKLAKLWSKDSDAFYVAFDKNQCIYSFWGVDTSFCDEVLEKAREKHILPSTHRLSKEVYNLARFVLRTTRQDAPDVNCTGNTQYTFTSWGTMLDLVEKCNFYCAILARTRFHLQRVADELDKRGVIFTGLFGWSTSSLTIYRVAYTIRNGGIITSDEFLHFVEYVRSDFLSMDKKMVKKSVKGLGAIDSEGGKNYLNHRLVSAIMNGNPFSYVFFTKKVSEKAINRMSQAWIRQREPMMKAYLMTIHGSKGLEWDNVVVIDGITTKIQDSIMSYRSEWENEARVWYVALTRARKNLFLVTSGVPAGLDKYYLAGRLR